MFKMKRIIKKLISRNNLLTKNNIQIEEGANFICKTNLIYIKGKISVGKDSTLIMDDNVRINGEIIIKGSSIVNIQKDVVIGNTKIIIEDSKVSIGEGSIFDCPLISHNTIEIENGEFILGEKTKIQSDILVRFGGKLNIGEYTGICYNAEIRCEEKIQIGAYCLISYDVCIFDTNTHSTNWEYRRERIKNSYPFGCGEIEKPKTSPIKIGNDVWLGKGATVTKGVEIGDRSIVGIRAVVSRGFYENDCIIVNSKPIVIKRNQTNENSNNS
jgi:acetyltransferase-like isoleucine patch superfamily enzyme